VAAGRVRFLVILYGLEGAAEALIEAHVMGAFRTGAASAVAARALSNPGPKRVAVIGSGWQARTQILALSRVLQVGEFAVYSRDPARREDFALSCAEQYQLPVAAAPSAEQAVRGSQVVVTITNSAQPVLEAGWVEAGATVLAAGSNFPNRQEIPPELIARCEAVVVDQLETARLESGDLIQAEAAGFDWSRVRELSQVLIGGAPGRQTEDGIVLFESQGLALWDVAAGGVVLERARLRRLGEQVGVF
jgi:ornithine cyclodeaminase/alanine dehydrogenase-like protein (mu-crystallin family)